MSAPKWTTSNYVHGVTPVDVRRGDGGVIASIPYSASQSEIRLIAAAPDLFEALKACAGELLALHPDDHYDGAEDCDCSVAKAWRNARTALSRATGGSND